MVYDEKNTKGKTPTVIKKKILWVDSFTNSRFSYMVDGIYVLGFIGFKIKRCRFRCEEKKLGFV